MWKAVRRGGDEVSGRPRWGDASPEKPGPSFLHGKVDSEKTVTRDTRLASQLGRVHGHVDCAQEGGSQLWAVTF